MSYRYYSFLGQQNDGPEMHLVDATSCGLPRRAAWLTSRAWPGALDNLWPSCPLSPQTSWSPVSRTAVPRTLAFFKCTSDSNGREERSSRQPGVMQGQRFLGLELYLATQSPHHQPPCQLLISKSPDETSQLPQESHPRKNEIGPVSGLGSPRYLGHQTLPISSTAVSAWLDLEIVKFC